MFTRKATPLQAASEARDYLGLQIARRVLYGEQVPRGMIIAFDKAEDTVIHEYWVFHDLADHCDCRKCTQINTTHN